MTGATLRRGWLAALVLAMAPADVVVAAPPPSPDPDADARAFARALADGVDAEEATDRAQSDPWLVAAALVGQGEPTAAVRWAEAWARRSAMTERLPAYVASRTPTTTTPPAAQEKIRRARALLRDREAQAAVLALEEASRAPDPVVEAERSWLLARASDELGKASAAATAAVAAADAADAVGWIRRSVEALHFAGKAFGAAYDPTAARRAFERPVALLKSIGAEDHVAHALNNAAVAAFQASDFAGAVRLLDEALEIRARIGTAVNTAELLANLATAACGQGQFGRALAELDRAAVLVGPVLTDDAPPPAAAADPAGVRAQKAAAWIEHGRGVVQLECGRLVEAERAVGRALQAAIRLRDEDLEALALGNLAIVHGKNGDAEAAERTYRASLALFEKRGDTPRVAQVLANLADLQSDAGRHDDAITLQEQALVRILATGDPLTAARTRGSIGTLHRRAGRPRRALELHEAARREAAALGATFVEAEQWVGRAAAHLDLGEDAAAVDAAQQAFAVFRTFAFGAGDAVGVSLQEAYDEMFEVGALASARRQDALRTAALLEAGRGAQLQSALGGRDVLAVVEVPPALVAEERAARAAETQAFAAWLERLRTGVVDAAAKARFAAARARTATVLERIQREQALAAHLAYTEPVTPEAVAKGLGAEEAFVWYGVFPRGVVAVVARPRGLRIVPLRATAAALADAVATVIDDDGSGATKEAIAALQALVVDPLGLAPDVRRVVVCPAGPLAYAPMGALLEGRTVVLVPSATALALLARDGAKPGVGVLALGDPTYTANDNGSAVQLMRGELRLPSLPATRAEALAVAEGAPPLLGDDATEAGLRRALAATKGRLRALHLACHGLVDRDQPLHSSLALTAADDDDGYLTGAEILRMRVDADLVVMSACTSGLGRVARGEGMLGLTRAFMFSGVPRVVASLWKVDDEATKALMLRFYARWRPKDGSKPLAAADALRDAQAHVKAQPRWTHPRYWAAWVLWGVLD